jgi:hypothetical protein
MQARICPPGILQRTRNASSSVKAAEKHGWATLTTIAGPDDDGQWSILVRCLRKGEKLSALWSGPELSGMGFEGAWHRPADGFVRKLNYGGFGHVLKGTTPNVTPKMQAEQIEDAKVMRTAVLLFAPLATGMRVEEHGTSARSCKGKAAVELGFAPCANPTPAKDVPLCSGTCVALVFDGTTGKADASNQDNDEE